MTGAKDGWVLYGAYGYTGTLIAEACAARGLRPLLAGRDGTRLAALAQRLDLPCRTLDLRSPDALRETLAPHRLVLHCAGPFAHTARPMLDAAIATGTHYLDITGEVDVFTMAIERDEQARAADVVLCPGAGFDVVPTDCVAATLAAALPQGNRLALGFDSRSSLSPGTTRTSLEGLASGMRTRIGGRLQSIPMASRTRRIDFGAGEKLAMAITWGDLVTAGVTTGIDDIDVFVPISPRVLARLRRLAMLRPLLAIPGVKRIAGDLAARTVTGPNAEERQGTPTRVWGEISSSDGSRRTARLTTANGYDVTMEASLAMVGALLARNPGGGYFTPSQLMGAEFISSLPGSSAVALSDD